MSSFQLAPSDDSHLKYSTNNFGSAQRRRERHDAEGRTDERAPDQGRQVAAGAVAGEPGSGRFMRHLGKPWYAYEPKEPTAPEAGSRVVFGGSADGKAVAAGRIAVTTTVVAEWLSQAEELLETETTAYETVAESDHSRDAAWMRQVLQSGTRGDKVAAMTLLLQQDTLHGLRHLASLVHMCAKRVRKEAYMALGTVKDVFQHTLLPPNRKLRPFSGSVEAWAASSGTASAPAEEPKADDDKAADAGAKGDKGGRRRGGRRRAKKAAAEAKEAAGRPGTLLVPCEPSSEQLTVWLLEDRVRQEFAAFLVALEGCANDPMAHLKRIALRCAAELLAAAPEGEARLLSLLVTKLGDPDRKVASGAAHHLSNLCSKHSAMKTIVVANVRAFVLDSSTSDRARYYGVTFLTQLPLHRGWRTLVTSLLGTYLAVFQRSLVDVERKPRHKGGRSAKRGKGGKGGSEDGAAAAADDDEASDAEEGAEDAKPQSKKTAKAAREEKVTRVSAEVLGSRLMGAILTGLNRALPYALSLPESEGGKKAGKGAKKEVPSAIAPLVEQLGAVFQLTRSGPLGTRVQALTLIHTVAAALAEQEGIQADGVAAAEAAAAADAEGGERATTGASLLKQFFISLYSLLVSPDLLPGRKSHHLLLNLLFKCLRREHSAARVAALLKRLSQVALTAQPSLACGILMLVSAVLKDRPGLLSLLSQAEVLPGAEAVPSKGTKAAAAAADDDEDEEADPLMAGAEADAGAAAPPKKGRGVAGMYDPRGRVPDAAGAAESCFWEILSLSTHFHPSVRAMAEAIMAQGTAAGPGVQYDGDPMADMTLMAFLDRLAFRKPKKKAIAAMEAQRAKGKKGASTDDAADAAALRGDSIMQRSGVQGLRTGFAAVAVPVDNRAFTSLPASKVRPEEAFVHGYFLAKTQRESAEGVEKKPKREETEEVGDEEGDAFANELAEAMMAEHAATAGGGLGDGEDDISDSEWAYEAGDKDAAAVAGAGGDSDSDSDGAVAAALAGGSDSEEEEAAPAPAAKAKGGKRGTKRERKSPFASADDFTQDVGVSAETEDATPSKGRGRRGGKKARK